MSKDFIIGICGIVLPLAFFILLLPLTAPIATVLLLFWGVRGLWHRARYLARGIERFGRELREQSAHE